MTWQDRMNRRMLQIVYVLLVCVTVGVTSTRAEAHTVFDVYGTVSVQSMWHQNEPLTLRHQVNVGMTAYINSLLVTQLLFQHKQTWGESYNPYFKTEEATITFQSQPDDRWQFGRWHMGRLRFQLGPIGMLAANPFDALEGIHWQYASPFGTSEVVYARIDTSYVTYLNYVYDHDDLIALRHSWYLPRVVAGLTVLTSGLSTERGASIDVLGTLDGMRDWVIEVAAYEQSKTSMTYDGWHMGVIGSVDLYVDDRTAVTLNGGYVEDGFVPMVSNLQYAGGSLGFSNGTSGVELYVSRSLQSDTVLELELGGRTRWQQSNSNVRLALTTAAYRPAIFTVSMEGRHQTDSWQWLAELSATLQF